MTLYIRLAGFFDFFRPHPDLNIENPKVSQYLGYPDEFKTLSAFQFLQAYLEKSNGKDRFPDVIESEIIDLLKASASLSTIYQDIPIKIIPILKDNNVVWISPWEISSNLQNDLQYYGDDQKNLLILLSQLEVVFLSSITDKSDRMVNGTRAFKSNINILLDGQNYHTSLEVFFNRLNPFFLSFLFLILGIIIQMTISGKQKKYLTLVITSLSLILYSSGLIIKSIITGRPPVTDLESSFLFVGWIFILFSLWLIYKKNERTGYILCSLSAMALILFSRSYSLQFDQFGQVQAVLDTNFWLAVHVLTISAGYAGVLASGVMAHMYMFRKIFLPYRKPQIKKSYSIMFAFLAIGLTLSFLGTMLGGIWADQSWGRFWGWDPKENGALLIIIWCSIIFHGKAGRIYGPDGFAATTIIAIPVVLFSWIGVNMLGVGLHSYGFVSQKLFLLVLTSIIEILIAIIGWTLLRKRASKQLFDQIQAYVYKKVKLNSNTVQIDLKLKDPMEMVYRTGQYITLFIDIRGSVYNRSYSLINSYDQYKKDGILSIVVKEEIGGIVSPYLVKKITVKEKIFISKASGHFHLNADSESRDLVLIAGGIGIAPILGLVHDSIKNFKKEVTLFYSAKKTEDLIYKTYFDSISQDSKLLDLNYFLTEEDYDSKKIKKGRITKESIITRFPKPDSKLYYICGSESFVESIQLILEDLNIESRQIFSESFSPAPRSEIFISKKNWTIRYDDQNIQVQRGQSILEASLNAGERITHSCLSGHCGECKVQHIKGNYVAMSREGLREEELKKGFMLSCQCYADENLELEKVIEK